MTKPVKRSLLVIVTAILILAVYYAWVSLPIITGFDAKHVCSCVFVSGRDKASLDSSEMGEMPFNIASYSINLKDSLVTSTIAGLAKRKAIYRNGLGCTLINGLSEKDIRSQVLNLAEKPLIQTDTIAWPDGDRTEDSISPDIDKAKLLAAVDQAFIESVPGKKIRTRAVVVVYDGQLIAEKYN